MPDTPNPKKIPSKNKRYEYQHRWYLENKDKCKDNMRYWRVNNKDRSNFLNAKIKRELHAIRKEELNKFKVCGCKVCGCNNLDYLHFHHRDKSSKLFEVSYRDKGWDKTLEEVSKCDVLCASCHGKLHGSERRVVGREVRG